MPAASQGFKNHDKTVPPAVRFWARVHKTPRCWLWKPSIESGRRGYIDVNCRRCYASVYSWILHNGQVPNGLLVCHSCDNPICVRPSHLWLGTALDNMRDCLEKGRFNHGTRGKSGEEHSLARLTDEDVREIRRRHVRGSGQAHRGNSQQLAGEFGMTTVQILNIANRRQWKHVD
jgi:HNH endonuclease